MGAVGFGLVATPAGAVDTASNPGLTPSLSTTNVADTSFAGWTFIANATKSVTAEYTVPTLTCSGTRSGIAPGAFVDAGSPSAVKFDAAQVVMECINGQPVMRAAVEVNSVSNSSSATIYPGDLIKVAVLTSATETVAKVVDMTSGHTFHFAKTGAGEPALQEYLIDNSVLARNGNNLPVVDFGALTFRSAEISGVPIGSVTPRGAYDLDSPKQVVEIHTGPINKAGYAFTTTFVSA
ncbi:MAG: hypothetical protein ACYCU7_17315 [Acidimicrobiales bacterium]